MTDHSQYSSGSAPVPEGATHMRRPEYITAWLFDRVSTMPIWLIEKYKSVPLPDDKIGHYATAIDGEFYRWYDPAKFTELFTSLAQRPSVADRMSILNDGPSGVTGKLDPERSGPLKRNAQPPMDNTAGIEWFERTFGVPLGDKPGAGDVERVRAAVVSSTSLGGAAK